MAHCVLQRFRGKGASQLKQIAMSETHIEEFEGEAANFDFNGELLWRFRKAR